LLLLLAGCGNWSEEDLEYIQAIPTKEQLTVSEPAGGESQALTEYESAEDALLVRSAIPGEVRRHVRAINAFVLILTAGLDRVRLIPPASRAPGERIWGPFPDDTDRTFEVRVVIRRPEEARFEYELQKRKKGTTEFTALATGEFFGQQAADGKGSIRFDAVKTRALGLRVEDEKQSAVSLAYEMLENGTRGDLEVDNTDGSSASIAYLVQNGAGEVRYVEVKNAENTATAAMETQSLTARWLKSGAGRGDFKITGGDFGSLEGLASECWDDSFQQVFKERNFECGGLRQCSEGDESKCALPAP